MKRLDEKVSVVGQIGPDQIAGLGVNMIVNNRPDGEEPDQPTSGEIEAAARAAGIGYRHIPISGGFSSDQVLAMAEALEQAEGQVLAFCKSGTRSTYLWALARYRGGSPAETLMASAAEAGYDLRPIAHHLR